MVVPDREIRKRIIDREARARASKRCPVYKKSIRFLNEGEWLDSRHAIEGLRLELLTMPEAAGMLDILDLILSVLVLSCDEERE